LSFSSSPTLGYGLVISHPLYLLLRGGERANRAARVEDARAPPAELCGREAGAREAELDLARDLGAGEGIWRGNGGLQA
jgi:hypothetical protein